LRCRVVLVQIFHSVVLCVYDIMSSQGDVSKKDEDDAVEPVPQISEFVVDDLRKYVKYISVMCSKTRI